MPVGKLTNSSHSSLRKLVVNFSQENKRIELSQKNKSYPGAVRILFGNVLLIYIRLRNLKEGSHKNVFAGLMKLAASDSPAMVGAIK